MKYFLLLTILYSTFTFGQTKQSDCNVPALLHHVYLQDVNALALKRIYEIKTPDTALMLVPQKYMDTIWQGLAAIYNTGEDLHADSVFNKYCIHYKWYKGAEIEVYVDNSAWTKAWENNQTITGFKPLDFFLSSYGFELVQFIQIMNYRIAYIRSEQPVNKYVFAQTLQDFKGIYSAIPDPTEGVPDRYITYTKDSESRFSFYLGWGDCPSGCTSAQIWKYSVDNNCNVSLLSSIQAGRDPYPYPVNCDLFASSVNPNMSLKNIVNIAYPNPAHDVLNLNLPLHKASYKLINFYGQIVKTGTLESNSIDLSELSNGNYLLVIQTEERTQYVQKIEKI